MENKKEPLYLCGGLLLTVLTDSFASHIRVKKRFGISQATNERTFVKDLVRIIFPTFKGYDDARFDDDTFKYEVSKYKNCDKDSSRNIPLNDADVSDAFEELLANDYMGVIHRFDNLLNEYMDMPTKANHMIKKCLEIIARDTLIDKDSKFYIRIDGKALSREELLCEESYDVQPFICGIWRYILRYRRDNKNGKESLKWLKENKGDNKYITDILGDDIRFTDKKVYHNLILWKGVLLPSEEDKDGFYFKYLGGKPVTESRTTLIALSDDDFKEYLEEAEKKYSKVKTLLDQTEPRPLREFFIPSRIAPKPRIGRASDSKYIIKDITVDNICSISRFSIISGDGGLGKTMLMRHILLDSISKYSETKRIPIFLSIKDYRNKNIPLVEWIYQKFDNLHGRKSIEDFKEILDAGRMVFLFDGLDELASDIRLEFESRLADFCDKYSGNCFIMTSRPYTDFISFERFAVFEILPFTLELSLALVERLNFEREIKDRFSKELKESLYKKYQSFAQNPLLLTIMLLVFEKKPAMPNEMHKFYERAYDVLTVEHDSNKEGYSRKLETGLAPDVFKDYFMEFCAKGYLQEEFDIEHDIAKRIYNALKIHRGEPPVAPFSAFIKDLQEMSLMYSEEDEYRFMHRSFQEYFAALFFSKQLDSKLFGIAEFFEKKSIRGADSTFGMLYDMRKKSVEKEVFLPYLKKLLCNEEGVARGYLDFLDRTYLYINYSRGELNDDESNPRSFLYRFITKRNKLKKTYYSEDISDKQDDDFLEEEFVYVYDYTVNYIPEENCNVGTATSEYPHIVSKNSVDEFYEAFMGEPEFCGTIHSVDISELMADEEYYAETIESLERESFGLKQEYRAVMDYYNKLKKEYEVVEESIDDLLNLD